ncbi:MAG: pitrilysin family protein [Pseudomonadota bacterium]
MIRFVVSTLFAVCMAVPASAAVDVQEMTTPGGIDAWLVEEHSIPIAAIEIRFRGGASLDAPGKRGAIHLMTALLEEGAGDLDAQGFAEAREEIAARIGFGVRDDSLSVSLRFLTENRDASFALLKTALIDPRFDQDAINRVRAQVISGIRSDATDPNAIAGNTLNALTWGDHPYGSPQQGTEASVSALTRDDLVDAHRAAIARDRIYVGAVGNITPEELSELLDDLLGDLPETGAPMPPDAAYMLEPGVTVVPFDTPQSVALFGHQGLARDDDDFLTAFVVNAVLGGSGFQSRLTQEVRVKRGLTYGIGAYLSPKDLGHMVVGQVATGNDRMAETVEVLRREWDRIGQTGLTGEELRDAKLFLTGAYPLRFDGNAQIARIMVGMQMDGLPSDYIANRNDLVDAVTLEEANRVAKRVYRPEDLHIVIVGQPEELEPSN